jgi:hypothetical protein
MIRACTVLALAAGCSEVVHPDPLGDYTLWPDPMIVAGNAPGHTNSIRIIYRNAAAADPMRSHVVPVGATIVKEVREDADGVAGALRYVGIMRKIGGAGDDDGGWLFSESETPGGEEVHYDWCWSRCHVAAPYNGAFYDYRLR